MRTKSQSYGQLMQVRKRIKEGRRAALKLAIADVSSILGAEAFIAEQRIWVIYAASIADQVQANLKRAVNTGLLTVAHGPAGGLTWGPAWFRGTNRKGLPVTVAGAEQYEVLPKGVRVNRFPLAKLKPDHGARLRWTCPSQTVPGVEYVTEWSEAGSAENEQGQVVCTCDGFHFSKACWHTKEATRLILEHAAQLEALKTPLTELARR